MSDQRSVQVDDHVLIKVDDQLLEYKIRAIAPEEIYISPLTADVFSLLIPIEGRWQVYGLNTPHSIEFVAARTGLTGIEEIDTLILLDLPYQALLQTCQVNKEINRICQNDWFWRQKIVHDFGDLTQYKRPNETYQQQYEGIVKT